MEKNNFFELVEIVKTLRKKCPWDNSQTHDSLKFLMLEECYEAIESINKNKIEHLEEELGDLLLHILLQSEIANENNEFNIDSLIIKLKEKLIRRHPHVFINEAYVSKNEQIKTWDKIKIDEGKISVISGLPKILPSLLFAQRLQEKTSKVGFDWNDKNDVFKKVKEEISELENSINKNENIEEEIGDLIFTLVNLARHLKLNAEESLAKTNLKFIKRFEFIENELIKNGKNIHSTTLSELDYFWEKSKQQV